MAANNPTITPEMEVEAKKHQELNNEIQDLQKARQKQLSQLNENTMVKQELDLISGDAKVYKKIGPTLVKQDMQSAKDWVSKRIEFVENRIKAVDKQVEEKREEAMQVENRVYKMQEEQKAKLQAQAAAAQKAGEGDE